MSVLRAGREPRPTVQFSTEQFSTKRFPSTKGRPVDSRSLRRRAGFTLIELLIVISIIAVLAGLITTSVTLVRQRAKKARAASEIASITLALKNYHTQVGVYPGANVGPVDNPESLFRALYTSNPRLGGTQENYLEDWKPSSMGIWPGSYFDNPDAEYAEPNEAQLNTETSYTPIVFLDGWGHPYHYVEWKSHPKSRRQLPGGRLRAMGGLPYMIWSNGADGKNDWGKKDDITSW